MWGRIREGSIEEDGCGFLRLGFVFDKYFFYLRVIKEKKMCF